MNKNKMENKQDESQSGIEGDYNLDEYSIDEQIIDTNSEKQNYEKIIQKMNASFVDKNYTIYTINLMKLQKLKN